MGKASVFPLAEPRARQPHASALHAPQGLTHESAPAKITLKPITLKSFNLATHSKPNYYIPDSSKPAQSDGTQNLPQEVQFERIQSSDNQFIPDSKEIQFRPFLIAPKVQLERIQSSHNQFIPDSKKIQFRPFLTASNGSERKFEEINLPNESPRKIFPDTFVRLDDSGNKKSVVTPQKTLEQFFGW